MNATELAEALRRAVLQQQFERTEDAIEGGAPLRHFPSIDLAVAAFPEKAPPVWANVLFSREHTQGVVAEIDADAGPVRNVLFLADQTDAQLQSIAWLPASDWPAMRWLPLAGAGPHCFVAPYPASVFKLMVALGVARAVDAGAVGWDSPWLHGSRERSVAAWCEDMIVQSCNDSTTAMVAWLHAHGAIERHHDREQRNDLHAAFSVYGLHTLRLANTRADGGWGNAAGAGVGHLQMTAWDTVRLLWLLDPAAPPAPWLASGTPPIASEASRSRLLRWLQGQGLHEVLSSTVLAGVPGWCAGIPAALPAHWVDAQGAAHIGEQHYPPDVRPAMGQAQVRFAHKTGTTENYASDAGIVTGLAPRRRHYVVAAFTNLGTRYAPHPACATTWRLPALGRAIDALMARWLEA